MKIKNLLIILIIFLSVFACSKDDDNFNEEDQAAIDDATIIDYLKTHYLDEAKDSIFFIDNGQSSLMDDPRMKVEEITYNDIDYKQYYLTLNEGVTISPVFVDSIMFTYKGTLMDSASSIFDKKEYTSWSLLNSFIPGWQYGFPNFKGGNVVINPDESFDYEDYGEGYLFIPSGLAYGNNATGLIEENSPLTFYITLQDVNRVDTDSDLVLSVNEDVDEDGDLLNDDTDSDGVPDFADSDDDGDGVLTKYEDINRDGNPMNDDTNGNGIPNYLDADDTESIEDL